MEEIRQTREALEYCRKYMMYAGEFDRITNALAALSRLEAYEAEAPKDTWQLARNLTGIDPDAYDLGSNMHLMAVRNLNEAAAAIEHLIQSRIAAEPKRVPMAMLQDLYFAWISAKPEETQQDVTLRIAARYRYEVTE
jgi:hypothetical protein